MLAFSTNYYGLSLSAKQSIELFFAYEKLLQIIESMQQYNQNKYSHIS